MTEALVVTVVLAGLMIIVVVKTAVVVPQQSAFVVERLGSTGRRWGGLPHPHAVSRRHPLQALAQGAGRGHPRAGLHHTGQRPGPRGRVLYLKVLNPERASYGVLDYMFAISQLAQTTLRSEMGKIDLDRTFEERTHINIQWSPSWTRPPSRGASRCSATRSRTSPAQGHPGRHGEADAGGAGEAGRDPDLRGERDAAINTAEGQKQQVIKASEARKQQQINEAEGRRPHSIHRRRDRRGIRRVAGAIEVAGGHEAVQLRVAEQYLTKFGELANASDTTMIVPASVADVASMIGMAMNVIKRQPPTPAGGAA